jgi:hypothetical protein
MTGNSAAMLIDRTAAPPRYQSKMSPFQGHAQNYWSAVKAGAVSASPDQSRARILCDLVNMSNLPQGTSGIAILRILVTTKNWGLVNDFLAFTCDFLAFT